MPSRLLLVAIGSVPRPVVAELTAALGRLCSAAIVPASGQPRPAYAFNKDRNQYHAAAILRRLSTLRAGAAQTAVLGITDVDLFVPDAPFVFGEADRDAQAAVLSLSRLTHEADGKPAAPARLRRRATAEAMHEVGLLLGLSACQDPRCAMYPCERPADVDRKGEALCGSCRAALGL